MVRVSHATIKASIWRHPRGAAESVLAGGKGQPAPIEPAGDGAVHLLCALN